MELLKTPSERLDSENRPYMDLFLAWKHDDKDYFVRVKPTFGRDYQLLYTRATFVPKGEDLKKYL